MPKEINKRQDEGSCSWEESISAWVDGDVQARPDELHTPYGRQLWETYHLIGDVLRSDELAILPSERFYARLSKAIDSEPTVLAPQHKVHHKSMRWGLPSVAVAAAIMAVVWAAQPYFSPDQQLSTDTVPVLATVSDDAWADYVDAHRDMSGIGPVKQVSYVPGVVNQ